MLKKIEADGQMQEVEKGEWVCSKYVIIKAAAATYKKSPKTYRHQRDSNSQSLPPESNALPLGHGALEEVHERNLKLTNLYCTK